MWRPGEEPGGYFGFGRSDIRLGSAEPSVEVLRFQVLRINPRKIADSQGGQKQCDKISESAKADNENFAFPESVLGSLADHRDLCSVEFQILIDLNSLFPVL